MNRIKILILFVVAAYYGFAQNVDSLWKVANNKSNPDTARLSALYDLAWVFVYDNPDSTYAIAEQQMQLAKQIKNKKWEAKAYNAMGAALQIRSAYSKAIEHYQKGLEIYEQIGDKKNLAGALGNIGSIYINLNKFEKALEYQLECLKLVQQMGNLEGVASSLNNICVIYTNIKNYDQALLYGEQAIEMYKHVGDYHGLASAYSNIGNVYNDLGNSKKAVEYINMALKISNEKGITNMVTISKIELAKAYVKQKDFLKVIVLATQGERESREQGDLETNIAAVRLLAQAYKEKDNIKEAYKYIEKYVELYDSLKKINNASEIARLEVQFHYAKKAAADSLKNAEEQKMKDVEIFAKNTQIENDRLQKIALYGGLTLLMISGSLMYNRFRITRKQKEIIEVKSKETEEQKIIIEEKQKEILSSIAYAKRLQEAILPPKKAISAYLPNSFICYKPKDIVAGDFYWMEHIDNKVLIAAADCTGHGVPGAMVSVVCSNALNRTVKEFNITEPGKVLDKTRELVIETFERSETEVKDGMDISLCLIDKTKNVLQWAGANNPLWIVRNNELIELKPTKQTIGKVDNPVNYTNHTVDLQNNDCVYVFTDGYADQFGGPNGKKYKYNQLSNLLVQISSLPVTEQLQKLEYSFEAWKGNLEQVDDVCIIGIRI